MTSSSIKIDLTQLEHWLQESETLHLVYIGFNDAPIWKGIQAKSYASNEIPEIIDEIPEHAKTIVICDWGERSFFLCLELRERTGNEAIYHLSGGSKTMLDS